MKNTKFKKGMIPWNKGTHITNSGSFKKGHKFIGKSIGEIVKGKIPWMKGRKHTEESKEKNRQKHLGRTAWNKGIGTKTPENKRIWRSIEMRLWREAVFARDNWTCQKYGTKGGTLHPHHILNFSSHYELRFAIDNGVTLSEKAHKEFHKKYGNKNNTKEQLEEFIGRIVN